MMTSISILLNTPCSTSRGCTPEVRLSRWLVNLRKERVNLLNQKLWSIREGHPVGTHRRDLGVEDCLRGHGVRDLLVDAVSQGTVSCEKEGYRDLF